MTKVNVEFKVHMLFIARRSAIETRWREKVVQEDEGAHVDDCLWNIFRRWR